MTVYARENETVGNTCIWDVVFEMNTGEQEDDGELPLLTTSFYDIDNSSHGSLSTSVVDVSYVSDEYIHHHSRRCGVHTPDFEYLK